ncbi:hypothetical protein B0H11DRAFT_1994235 [Mycena galericulata]|nr:hypothetical protein B0H11DRAFT_1994235 [Mycena galericulata]
MALVFSVCEASGPTDGVFFSPFDSAALRDIATGLSSSITDSEDWTPTRLKTAIRVLEQDVACGKAMVRVITACCCQARGRRPGIYLPLFPNPAAAQGVMSGIVPFNCPHVPSLHSGTLTAYRSGQIISSGPTLGTHPTTQGTIVAIYDIGFAVASLIEFSFGEAIGRKRIILPSAATMLVGKAVSTSSTTIAQLYVSRIVTALTIFSLG